MASESLAGRSWRKRLTPVGTKGARLSSQISIAGRMLVYLPQDEHIGISQKIGSAITVRWP